MGRPIKYDDPWHVMIRINQREYYRKNRKFILYANKNGLTVAEARRILKNE